MSYGLGSMNSDLPTFVVMITQGIGNMQALSARFWGSGFLPSEHQGCKLRAGRDAVLHLRDPDGVSREDRRLMLDLAAKMNEEEFAQSLDPEVQARIAQYEMAYRMQMSVPELTDISDESEATLEMYGPDVRTPGSFAANCLQARRLSERGVRFIQLYMRGWDQHGNLPGEIRAQAKAVDQPQAALLADLKQRGMLDDTLVLWAGEFGRTVYSQGTLTERTTAGTIIPDVSPSGSPAAASSPASPTERPTTTRTTSSRIPSRSTTSTRPCFISSASITSAWRTAIRAVTIDSPTCTARSSRTSWPDHPSHPVKTGSMRRPRASRPHLRPHTQSSGIVAAKSSNPPATQIK